jgi:hypothetical protein
MHNLKLPPLILHPFADGGGPDKLAESSRANLMLQGLLPTGERSSEDLRRSLLDGRFCEIRMLFYVGKDLTRWIEHCLEHIDRNPELRGFGISYQSFAGYLVESTPPSVQTKLREWGVADYKAIFSRALGLCTLLGSAPHPETLSREFVRNYYRYVDQVFQVRQSEVAFTDISSRGLDFEIYASSEYSRMLECEWAES